MKDVVVVGMIERTENKRERQRERADRLCVCACAFVCGQNNEKLFI
jgi:hypothetical protein